MDLEGARRAALHGVRFSWFCVGMNVTFAFVGASAGDAFSTILATLMLIFFWFQVGTWNARLTAVDLIENQNDTTDSRSSDE
jgi:hypothetical protein